MHRCHLPLADVTLYTPFSSHVPIRQVGKDYAHDGCMMSDLLSCVPPALHSTYFRVSPSACYGCTPESLTRRCVIVGTALTQCIAEVCAGDSSCQLTITEAESLLDLRPKIVNPRLNPDLLLHTATITLSHAIL